MEFYGYAGKILHVDLTTGESVTVPLDLETADNFVGGEGICAESAYRLLKPEVDALSPENPIILNAGPLVGTLFPGAVQTILMTKGATSGIVRKGAVGGSFGPMMKWAGYDGLVITGRADSPVYLKIFDDKVELMDARELWGKDTYETPEELWGKHGKECSVMCIGQAGENLVKIAMAFVDKVAHLGKDGFGAVMGSKNLKAIVVRGTKGVRIADKKRFLEAVNRYLEGGRRIPLRKEWQRFGLLSFFEQYVKTGQMFTTRNRRESITPELGQRFGKQEMDKIIERSYACPACHIGDKCFLKLKEGRFEGLETTLSAMLMPIFAACSGADSGYPDAVKIHDMCNRYGICELASCSVIVWLIDLFENGVITSQDTDGIIPGYNFETLSLLLEKTVNRDGIGDVIADGFKGAIERIGRGSEKFAVHVKGLEIEFDPRAAFGSEAFSQCTRPSGGAPPIEAMALTMRDGEVDPRHIIKWVEKRGVVPEEAMSRVFVGPPSEFHVGRYTAHMENWYTILDCLGICARPFVGMFCYKPILAELYSAATGIERSHDDLLSVAEKVWNMVKVVNLREGYTRKDDAMPDRIFNEPLKFGDKEYVLSDYFRSHPISREEWEWLLDGYYDERGWDLERGWPTKAKLAELGLKDIADDLMRNGYSIKEKTEPISRENPWEQYSTHPCHS